VLRTLTKVMRVANMRQWPASAAKSIESRDRLERTLTASRECADDMVVLEELEGVGEGDDADDGEGLAPEAVTEQALADEAEALLSRPKGRDTAAAVSRSRAATGGGCCRHSTFVQLLLTPPRTRSCPSWAPPQVFTGHTAGVYALALSPSGGDLASGSGDDTARVWDAATGACRQVLTGHGDSVTCVAFNHDGSLLATASLDGAVKVWKRALPAAAAADPAADAWLLAHSLEGPTSDVEWLQWHFKGEGAVSRCFRGALRLSSLPARIVCMRAHTATRSTHML
jgi:hypothetical protein